MALNHPVDPPPHHGGPHPAISLLVGFGVVILGPTVVHVVFNPVGLGGHSVPASAPTSPSSGGVSSSGAVSPRAIAIISRARRV